MTCSTFVSVFFSGANSQSYANQKRGKQWREEVKEEHQARAFSPRNKAFRTPPRSRKHDIPHVPVFAPEESSSMISANPVDLAELLQRDKNRQVDLYMKRFRN